MKIFILSLFFVIFALFNVSGEDLLHPVIRDDIDEDIKKIEQALVDYVLYPEMVERGFDVHRLDNMKIDGEMFEYIESFFRPNDEKGWVALDNHHSLSIKDENGKWFRSQSYKKYVKFSNEYGTKDELLKKGYVENETMFYYPSNGEKDWRVGKWTWYNWKGWAGPSSYSKTYQNKMTFAGGNYVYGDGKNVRDWLYVVDHARAIDVIFHKGKIAETYNIGGFNEWKNIDLIKVMIKTVDRILGNPEGQSLGLITYVTDRLGHDARYAIDSTKLQKELGWEPSLQFEEGIEKTVRWYLDNQEWMDNITSGEYEKYYEEMYKNR